MTQEHNLARVECHREACPYSRMIFGQFLEQFGNQVYGGVFDPGSPLADERGFRTDVVKALRELRIPVVRWPGGCFVSSYHWQKGVGPRRQPYWDKAWAVEESNRFGTDEFIDWCRLIDAEPYICANAGTGTSQEMSDWVEYCNLISEGEFAPQRQANGHERPHEVKYWSVGNENYGFWEMGAKTKEEWGYFVAESAKMMKRVDPDIQLLAAASMDNEWNLELLKRAGDYLDFISVHWYADHLSQFDLPSDYDACMTRALQAEELLAMAKHVIAVAGLQGRVGIALDEWNLRGWHHPVTENKFRFDIEARDRNDIHATYTMADAVYSAGVLNACLRNCDVVKMSNMAPVVNTRGPLFVHPEGVVRRTHFHVMSMYANHLQPNWIDCWVDCEHLDRPALTYEKLLRLGGAIPTTPMSRPVPEMRVPTLDVVATCNDEKNRWSIVVVNRHASREVSCTIGLGDKPLSGDIDAIILSGASTDDFNDVEHPDRVAPAETHVTFDAGRGGFPPHSVTILKC